MSSSAKTTDEDRIIGGRIRQRREELGLSQKDLGTMLGISYQQVHKFERGQNRLTAGRLMQICTHLDCEPNHLMGAPKAVAGGPTGPENDRAVAVMAKRMRRLPRASLEVVQRLVSSLPVERQAAPARG